MNPFANFIQHPPDYFAYQIMFTILQQLAQLQRRGYVARIDRDGGTYDGYAIFPTGSHSGPV